MTRTFALSIGLVLLCTGITSAQYGGYPQPLAAAPHAVAHPMYQVPVTRLRRAAVTSQPYYEPVRGQQLTVERAYGFADTPPALGGNCGQCSAGVPLPQPSTVLQPVGVPSLGAYAPPPAYVPPSGDAVTDGYNVGRGLFGSPKFYRTGEPIRNMLRFLTL